LKEQNDKKDNEITRMEVLVESLKEQLEQALELVDKLQNERELIKLDIEKKLVVESEKRTEFIIDMIKNTSKNTMVLYSNVKDKYGLTFYNRIKEERYKII
jgi:hypothetical protein